MKRMKMRLFTAAVALASAFTAAHADGLTHDWTGIMKNPGFESGFTNWTLLKNVTGNLDFKIVTSADAAEGASYYNAWGQKVKAIRVSQKMVLPAGQYKLTAQLTTNTQGVSDQHIYVKTSAQTFQSGALTNSDLAQWATLSVEFNVAGEEEVTFGVESTGDGNTEKGWFRVDDFRLFSNQAPDPNMDQTVSKVTTPVTLSGSADFHITGTEPFGEGGSIDITNLDHAVLFFDNIRPTDVKANWLKNVKINGADAVMNTNCQLRPYDHGTLLFPYTRESKTETGFHPLTVYSEPNCQGTSYNRFGLENSNGFMNTLTAESLNNSIRSFTLKRGYMVTFAVGSEGWGYSRCFIAEKEDLVVNNLPDILDGRISSYRVFRFDNLGKNGVANITDTSRLRKLNCTWTYTWGAGAAINADYECVPHMNHLWSTSIESLGRNDQSPYLKTDNEPANSADPSPATVAQELERWPQLMRTGRRLLSPSSFDGGIAWHTQFFDSIDARGWRCDINDVHSYWNEGTFGTLKSNWADKYKRPIWITEFIWGASWSGGLGIFSVATTQQERDNPSQATLNKNREVLERILTSLNGMNYVERYAYWNDERNCSKILWNDNLTPAGEFYAQMKTGVSYTGAYEFVPREWRCDAPKNFLANYDLNRKVCTVKWTSYDCDLVESHTLQRREGANGEWETIKVFERPDSVDFVYDDPVESSDKDYAYRVMTKTWKNKVINSGAINMGLFIVNGGINAESKTNIMGWTCQRNAENGNTKHNQGDTYFEVWDSKAENIDFNYYQDLKELPAGVYKLQANCFNTTDNVAGASVNGHMGLYAECDGVLYFAPVTRDGLLDTNEFTSIDTIVVRKGTMRLGIRNIGRMGGRWAGGDNFKLSYLGTEEEVLGSTTFDDIIKKNEAVLVNLMPEVEGGYRDATGFIMNADCSHGNTNFWTATNLSTGSGESYDGNANNKYFDKNGSSSLNSSMQQVVMGLPAGEYEYSAVVRGSTGLSITLQATFMNAEGRNKAYNQVVKGVGNTAAAGSPYQRGWMDIKSNPIEVTSGGKLTLLAKTYSATGAWWSTDHFRLLYKAPVDGIVSVEGSEAEVVETRYFNLQGQQIAQPESGLYIQQTIYSDGTCKSEKMAL